MNFKQFERRICFKTQTKYLHIALYYIKIDATQMLRIFFFALEGKRPNRELLLISPYNATVSELQFVQPEAPDVTHGRPLYEKAKKMSKNITEIGILKNPISIEKLKNIGGLCSLYILNFN